MSDTPQFTTADLAELWGVTRQFVRNQVHDGKLHASARLKSGEKTVFRFSEADVAAYDSDPTTVARLRRIRARRHANGANDANAG